MNSHSPVVAEIVFAIAAVFIVLWSSGALPPESEETEAHGQEEGSGQEHVVILTTQTHHGKNRYRPVWRVNRASDSKIILVPDKSYIWSAISAPLNLESNIFLKLEPNPATPADFVLDDIGNRSSGTTPFAGTLPLPGRNFGVQQDISRTAISELQKILSADVTMGPTKWLSDVAAFVKTDTNGVAEDIRTLAREKKVSANVPHLSAVVIARSAILRKVRTLTEAQITSSILDLSKKERDDLSSELNLAIQKPDEYGDIDSLQTRFKGWSGRGKDIVFGNASENVPSPIFATDDDIYQWFVDLPQNPNMVKWYATNVMLVATRLLEAGKLPSDPAIKEKVIALALPEVPRGPYLGVIYAGLISRAQTRIEKFDVEILTTVEQSVSRAVLTITPNQEVLFCNVKADGTLELNIQVLEPKTVTQP